MREFVPSSEKSVRNASSRFCEVNFGGSLKSRTSRTFGIFRHSCVQENVVKYGNNNKDDVINGGVLNASKTCIFQYENEKKLFSPKVR